MSQLPQPPEGLGPEDFAPMGVPQPEYPQRHQPGTLTNGWAIASLVSGLLGCVPYAMGVIALVTGIIGLKKTSDPRYTGRGMAIGGIVLGALSLVFWLFFSTMIFGLFKAAGQPRQLAQDFVKMTSEGAIDAAMQHAAPNVEPAEMERLAAQMQEWGACQDVTSYSSSIKVAGGLTTCEVQGTATFADAERPFAMTLIKQGDAWKVSRLVFD
ncbi:MAG TPA: DUF4190 domain-containing protein [Tepidisphaeraceae bacterium]|nr:DUF4190 domain-containing protein [Tepidisphaeraceae bacterium]